MKIISYDGRVYVTDGHSKRYIPHPDVMNNLLAAAGQQAPLPVKKATFDFLEDHVSGTSLRLSITNCDARVENLTRIVIDSHT